MTQTRPEPKVIIIPAKEETLQDQKKKKNLRVAAYCRVSTKKDEQLGSGLYHTVILGANVSRLLRECVIPGASALVLLRPSDAGFAVDPQFNRSEKLDVYTDCTAAIEAMKAVEKPENITLHSLSEWNG